VTTPAEVVQMEKYKVGLLAEMGRVKAQASAIRESVFFLLRADHELQPETQELVLKLHTWPDRLDAHVQLCDEKHDGERQALEADVAKLRADFERDTQTLEASLREVGQWGDPQACWQNIEKLTQYQRELTVQEERMTCLLEQEKMIHGTAGKLVGFQELRAWFAPYADLWTAVHSVMSKRRFWLDCSLPEVDPTEVDATIRNCNRTIKRLQQALPAGGPPARALSALSHDVADLADQMPLIEVLCSPALRPRHWADVQGAIASAVSQEDLTLAQVKLLQLHRSLPELTEIGERARREARLEQMLSTMEGDWTKQSLELTALRNTDIRILAGASVEAMQQRLDEHYLVAQTVRSSPDVAPLQERAEAWEQQLAHLQDVLEVWLRVQANFLYLEPVLQAEDIRTTLPAEAEQFQEVLAAWQDLTARAKPDLPVLELVSQPDLLGVLKSADDKLEAILKSLHTYLETKRESFPRFFFLSNEELLEILGESRKPERVQPHLKKCFEGIDRLVFEARAGGAVITGLLSKEGEHVAVLQAVAPHEFQGAVEKWLLELETQMEAAVRDLIFRCIVDYAQARSEASRREQWLHEWQGQAILVSSQHSWTERVEQALQSANANRSLTACFAESRRNLAQIVALVREALPDLTRQTLGSLIVLDVHARDVLEELIDRQTSGVQDFQWISRLRTYLDSATKQLSVRMVTTVVEYGHEYLGAASRLVITPLTDRCYRTLMTALELNLGGAPEGPAGTGKTETTKDLAKAVAVHCLVFNCAEGLDALAMAKFFKGLASAGSWSCFDEFNRIDVEVLSVVAQQILEIQTAKGRGLARFLFEESWLTLKPRCNIFITMNPGYAGRAELPDNLKALFRPVAMMIPDYAMIGEITLYSYGFLESKGLAEKIVATFRLCSEQLSAQNHYDYGMRAVKAVLSAARQLK
jgi:dynein heavy chain